MGVEALLKAAGELGRDEQLELLERLKQLVDRPKVARHSITELRGLGKEVWEGIDAQEYVDAERRTWGG